MRTGLSTAETSGFSRQRILTKSIRELPAETDEQIGYEFRRLRVASGLSANRLSATLGISLRTLEHLEKGVLSAIPEQAKAARLVTEYCRVARVDPRPLQSRLKAYANTLEVKRGQSRWSRSRRRGSIIRGALVVLLLSSSVAAGAAIVLSPDIANGMIERMTTGARSGIDFAISYLRALIAAN